MKKQCPRCAARGKDTRGDNLHVYLNSGAYCFSCGYYELGTPSLEYLRSRINDNKPKMTPDLSISYKTLSTKLPHDVRLWLAGKHIEPDYRNATMYWNEEDNELVFPVYNKEGKITFSANRYFGKDPKHPRYINRGMYKDNMLLLGDVEANTTVFIVEDYISALRIATTQNNLTNTSFCAYPIFGSNVIKDHILHLSGQFLGAIFFLDPDKRREAFQMKMDYKHLFEFTDTVYTSDDPKDMTPEDLSRCLHLNYKNAENYIFRDTAT